MTVYPCFLFPEIASHQKEGYVLIALGWFMKNVITVTTPDLKLKDYWLWEIEKS